MRKRIYMSNRKDAKRQLRLMQSKKQHNKTVKGPQSVYLSRI